MIEMMIAMVIIATAVMKEQKRLIERLEKFGHTDSVFFINLNPNEFDGSDIWHNPESIFYGDYEE